MNVFELGPMRSNASKVTARLLKQLGSYVVQDIGLRNSE